MATNSDRNLSDPGTRTGNTKVHDPANAASPRRGYGSMALLIGGLVLAVGLATFLFSRSGGEDTTRMSTTNSSATSRAAGTVTTPAPATAPTSPAPRQ